MMRPNPGAPPPSPIPLKERASIVFLEKGQLEDGDGVIAWDAPNDAGFTFETFGQNRRTPVDFDGFRLLAFRPQDGT
jgi:CRISPR-associated protein Cas2